jgi:hypothetical protein
LNEGSAASFFEAVDVNSSAVFRDAFVIMLHCWQVPYDIGREDRFGAIDQEVRGLPRWLGGLSP